MASAATSHEPAAFWSANTSALKQWFQAVDTDDSKEISVVELQRALEKGGLKFSLKLVSSLIRVHDGDASLKLDFNEFCELHRDLQKMQQRFAREDQAHKGALSLPQIEAVLKSLGFTLDLQPEGAFYKLVKSYDFNQKGEIGLDSFIAMCIQVHRSTERSHMHFQHFRVRNMSIPPFSPSRYY